VVTSSTCRFDSPRGHEVAARIERPDGPVRATAVFAHCFTCSKDLRAARRVQRALADRGIAVLSFDFAGLGASGGEFSETTFSADVADLVAAAGYLADTIAAPTLLVGHSLGGAAVLTAADRLSDVRAVATIGAPADVEHVRGAIHVDEDRLREDGEAEATIGGRRFTVGAAFVEDLSDQHLLERMPDLGVATLFLHAPLDDTVGIDNAARLFQAARHPRSFVSLDDADHLLTDPDDAAYAAEVIASWATRYLPAEPVAPARTPETGDDDASAYDDPRVVATTRDGLNADVVARGFNLRVDEPEEAGGTETGPTPYEYLGAALASCTSMTLRIYADRKGYPLEQATVSVDFERLHARDCADCEHSEGRIELFRRHVELHGDLDEEQRADLLRIADRCPVHRTLEGQIEVRTTPAS